MKIVISGAGDIGIYLAKMLTKENHDIVMIDLKAELLKEVDNSYDIMCVEGSCTSFTVLKEANTTSCDLFIAVTDSEDTNILACVFAKKLGAKKTVARVGNMEYLNPLNKLTFINLGIDRLIYPEYIAAKEIVGVIKQTGTTEIFEFSGGKLTLFVIKLDENSPIINMSLRESSALAKNKNYRAVAITRNGETIIPRGDDMLLSGDIIYIITSPDGISSLLKTAGKEKLELNNVMFLGGSRIGIKSAKFLENHLNVKMVEFNAEKSFKLVDLLPKTMIINGDGRNVDVLIEEGIEKTDIFVAVTGDAETNILTCLLAKRYGVKKVIAVIENLDYIDIASKMGIDTIINKKLSAASAIYTLTMKAEVSSIKCLTGTDAEVLEFITSRDAIITKNKLKDVDLPEGVIVAGIVRGKKSFIALGDTQIKPNDKVVLFALPTAIHKIAYYF
ncbi:MAG: Trk system potassium transporter TrkA [Bacteroidales bacterium]|nr:Trk system potassium transporter TrkA [Bacteroidales bacterium]MDD4216017.1 Trk system potassium transporter TrkA [Bacteroidales bacterium]MDY0140292.1 Trk system potassium transporter TrkA [Bacteroidales bacterium]